MTEASTPLFPELPPGEYIRVLDLCPGLAEQDLVGALRITKLGKCPYTALSYVCGETALTHYINVSGHELGIYKNAFELLVRFRDPDEVVTVWIDGICINQNDAEEKEREVAFMYKIYETAQACNVWLGPEDESSRLAMQYANTLDGDPFLHDYSHHLEFGGSSGYWESKAHVLDVLADHPDKQNLINACANFLLRRWFGRVWCSQEGAVSTNTNVYCGSDHVPWFNVFALAWLFLPRWTISWPGWFMEDYALLEPNLVNAVNIQRYRLRIVNIENGASFVPTSLLMSVLQTSAWRQQCYDPQDKIYASRNIASDAKDITDDWTPKPDYTIPWRELYTNLAVTLAKRGDKDVLRLSGILRQSHDTVHRPHRMTCRFKASLAGEDEQNPKEATASTYGIASRMSFSQNNIDMNLPTIMQDGILYLSGLVPNWQKYRDIKISYQAVATIDQENVEQLASFKSETYITSETLMDAYNSTLIANTTDRDAIASPSYVEEVPAFHEAVENLDTFRKKQFCITERGYLYLVPAVTQPTDVVAIIKGLDMPSLLRPIDTCHSYIGDCYVHGMMGLQATNLIDEFSIKVRDGKPMWRAEGDVRRNGLSLDVGEYKRVLETLGERWVDLI